MQTAQELSLGGKQIPATRWRLPLLLSILIGSVLMLFNATRAESNSVPAWHNADVDTALELLGHSPEEAVRLQRLTAYNPVPRQTDSDPETSSCGPTRPDQLALSRDLFFDPNGSKHLCGAKVRVLIVNPQTDTVEQVEERIVWDTMHRRYEATGDIFLNTTDESLAYEFGVKAGVVVFF